MDMNFENTENVAVQDYLDMIGKKTAVLLGCSLQMGAINAGVSIKNQHLLYEFGKHLGIAFQLLDDLLDAFAKDAKKFGKQPGGDIIANKKLIGPLHVGKTQFKPSTYGFKLIIRPFSSVISNYSTTW